MNATHPNTTPVNDALLEIGDRRWRRRWLAAWVWATAAWVAAAWVLMFIDAAVGLSRVALVVVFLVWIAVLPVVGWWLMPRRRDRAADALCDARLLEQAHGLGDAPLTNAIALHPDDTFSPFASALARRSVRRGDEALEQLEVEPLLGREALRKAAAYLWLVMVLGSVMVAIQPRLITTSLARVAWPWSDAISFDRTRIDVDWVPQQPRLGEDLTITATVDGRPVETADLVELDARGTPIRRLPMDLQDENDFRYRLQHIDSAGRYRVEADGSRSADFTIRPVPRQELASVSGAASDATDAGGSPTTSARQRAAELAAEAATLRSQVDLARADPDSATLLPGLRDAAARCAAGLRDTALKLPAPEKSAAGALAAALEAFASGHSPSIARAPLSAGGDAMDSGFVTHGGGDARGTPAPRAQGSYDEATGDVPSGQTADALANQVPAEFRPIVRRYFERLAEDEQQEQSP